MAHLDIRHVRAIDSAMAMYAPVVRSQSITKNCPTSQDRLAHSFNGHLFVTKHFYRVPAGLEKGTVPHFRNPITSTRAAAISSPSFLLLAIVEFLALHTDTGLWISSDDAAKQDATAHHASPR